MLLNHFTQRKRSLSRDRPLTVLNRTQPIFDQNRSSLNHTPIRRTLRQDTLENVTEVDSTFNGFTHNTETHEDVGLLGCMVIGHKINHSPPRPGTSNQKQNNRNLNQRRYSARPISQQSQGIRTPIQEQKAVKPVLGLPLDVTAVFDYRFSPFHDETVIRYQENNRTLSADVPRTKHSAPSEEDSRPTEERMKLRRMREKNVINNQISAVELQAGLTKLNKPSYAPSEDNLSSMHQQAAQDTSERSVTLGIDKDSGSGSTEIDDFDLSPDSKGSPQKDEIGFENRNIPKEGSLLGYFRTQMANRPKSGANYRQVIEAKKVMYETMATEQESSNSPVKEKRGNVMAQTRTVWSRKGQRGRRTISYDSTVVDTTVNETTVVAEVNKSVKAPSSIDVFSEKVKKYIEIKKEEDTGISNMDDESFLRSFLKNEYSMLESIKEKSELTGKNFINLGVTPFTIDDEKTAKSPSNAMQKANNAIGLVTRTRKRAVAHHRAASDSSRINKLKDPDENTVINNMDELVVYVKGRNQFVEESIKKVEEERERQKWNGRLIDTMLNKVKAKGGVHQTVVRSSKQAMKFERDIEEIKEVRNDISDVKREMKLIHITKDELYNEKRQRLDKAKFVSPNRLTNTELEFVRDEFLLKKPEDMNIDKLDDLLKRLKFFAQLSRGVRISFYNCANYIKEQRGHYIFHQGDIGDLMYIILRGSVNVKVPKRLKDGSCQFITVASLYDGSHFGELAIMAVKQKPRVRDEEEEEKEKEKSQQRSKIKENLMMKKSINPKVAKPQVKEANIEPKPAGDGGTPILQKRSASIQCAEETEMLTMSRDKFQEILLLVMNTDMDTKIRLLQLTNFYKRESNFTLMPVANNMKALRFKLGQRVIQKGEILMNFYIIAKGTCKVVQEIEEEYDYDAGIYEGKLKPFIYKDFTDIDGKEEEGARQQADYSMWKYPPNPMLRTFDYGLPDKDDEKKDSKNKSKGKSKGQKFIKHVIYKEMSVGDFFGFRPLLRPESDAKYKQLNESKAKLSVVAYSPDVEIFALPRASLLYLPERVKSMLLDGISKLKDFDNVDIHKPMQEQKAWRESQLKLIEDTLIRPEHANLRRPRDTYKAR